MSDKTAADVGGLLGVVAAVIAVWMLTSGWWALLMIGVMLLVASIMAARQ